MMQKQPIVKAFSTAAALALAIGCNTNAFTGDAGREAAGNGKKPRNSQIDNDVDANARGGGHEGNDDGVVGADGPDGAGGVEGVDAVDGESHPDAGETDSSSLGHVESDGNGEDNGDLGENDGGADGGDPLTDDSEIGSKPLACTTATVKFAPGNAASCPSYYAAYTADDGKSLRLGCCPLPARDILSKEAARPRASNCEADEVATGVSGGGPLCTRINTKKYRLAPATKTCYVGDGVSGGSDSKRCGVPSATFKAMVATMGSDACIGVPYGALIVGRTSKDCRDVTSSQLFYVEGDAAVTMHE